MRSFNFFLFVAIIVAIYSCKKSATSISYTAKMGGIRHWHCRYYTDPGPPSAAYVLNDTAFVITIINNTTISLFGYKLSCDTVDEINGIYYFGSGYFFSPAIIGIAGAKYYYNRDSIVYGTRYGVSTPINETIYYTY